MSVYYLILLDIRIEEGNTILFFYPKQTKKTTWTDCIALLESKTGILELDNMTPEHKACFYIDAARAREFATLSMNDKIVLCPFLALLFDLDGDPGYLLRTVETWKFIAQYKGEINSDFYLKLNELAVGKFPDNNIRKESGGFCYGVENLSAQGLTEVVSFMREVNAIYAKDTDGKKTIFSQKERECYGEILRMPPDVLDCNASAKLHFTARFADLSHPALEEVPYEQRSQLGFGFDYSINQYIAKQSPDKDGELFPFIYNKVALDKQYSDVKLRDIMCHFTVASQDEEVGKRLMSYFVDQVNKADTPEEVIKQGKKLELLHFFRDGNTRSAILLINKRLLELGVSPLLLADPNCIDGLGAKEIYEKRASALTLLAQFK